jgi:hypothetical protein
MNDQSIEELRKTVEIVLFEDKFLPNHTMVTSAQLKDAQHAYVQLMQELEDTTTSSGYSSGYRAGWNDALFTIESHCENARKS